MGIGTTEVGWMIMASAVLRQLCYLVLNSPEGKNIRIFYPPIKNNNNIAIFLANYNILVFHANIYCITSDP